MVVVVVEGAWVGRGGGLKQASDKDIQIPGAKGELFDNVVLFLALSHTGLIWQMEEK